MAAARLFDDLLAAHGGEVVRLCRAILRDEHLGADAAQDAYLRVWRHLSAGRRPEQPRAWLRTVAVSAALDLLRRRTLRLSTDARFAAAAARGHGAPAPHAADTEGDVHAGPAGAEADVHAEPAGNAPDPLRDAALAELLAALAPAVDALPEGQRTIFLLRHEGGLPLREVAECLGLSLPTVKTQFARACLKLAARLRPFAPDERPPP